MEQPEGRGLRRRRECGELCCLSLVTDRIACLLREHHGDALLAIARSLALVQRGAVALVQRSHVFRDAIESSVQVMRQCAKISFPRGQALCYGSMEALSFSISPPAAHCTRGRRSAAPLKPSLCQGEP